MRDVTPPIAIGKTFEPDIEAMLGAARGPLDVPLSYTIFPARSGTTLKRDEDTLRDFARQLLATSAGSKDALPLVKLATFGDQRTPFRPKEGGGMTGGSYRSNANMLSVSGVEVDYDAGPITLEDAAERLRAAGIAAIVYDSPSAAPGVNKWRGLVVLADEADPATRRAHVAVLNRLFDGGLDPASFTMSQAFYFGRVGERVRRVLEIDGDYIDRVSGIAPLFPDGGTAERTSEAAGAKTGLSPEDFASAVRAVENDHRFDQRTDWLRFGAAIYHETDGGEDGRALFHEWSEKHGTYDEDRTDAAWESLDPPRSTGATVLLFARSDGWERERDGDFEEEAFDPESITDPEDRALLDLEPLTTSVSPLAFLTPDQCAAMPARDYVLKGMIAPGDVGCIFGEPGAGKSLGAPLIGYRVAQGERVFGMRTKRGDVLYVAAEDGHRMCGRVRALREQHGEAAGFLLLPGVDGGLFDFRVGRETPTLRALRAEIKQRRPAIVFIDTLAMAFPGLDENDANAMGAVVMVGRKLAEHGAAVVFVHHTPKGGDTPRGHSVFNGAMDFALFLKPRDEGGTIRGRLTKNRNGSPDQDTAFRIGVAEFERDADGDVRTAAYALETTAAPAGRSLAPSSVEALKVFNVLAAGTKDGRVAMSDWQKACKKPGTVSNAEDDKSRGTAFTRASQDLLRRGYVEARDGYVSRPDPDYARAFEETDFEQE